MRILSPSPLSAGRLHRLRGVHRCHQPDAERRNQPKTEVVLQAVRPGRQRQDRQGRTGDHLLGNSHTNTPTDSDLSAKNQRPGTLRGVPVPVLTQDQINSESHVGARELLNSLASLFLSEHLNVGVLEMVLQSPGPHPVCAQCRFKTRRQR